MYWHDECYYTRTTRLACIDDERIFIVNWERIQKVINFKGHNHPHYLPYYCIRSWFQLQQTTSGKSSCPSALHRIIKCHRCWCMKKTCSKWPVPWWETSKVESTFHILILYKFCHIYYYYHKILLRNLSFFQPRPLWSFSTFMCPDKLPQRSLRC